MANKPSAPTTNISKWKSSDFMQFVSSVGITGNNYGKIKQVMEDNSLEVTDIKGTAEDFASLFGVHKIIAKKIRTPLYALRLTQLRFKHNYSGTMPQLKDMKKQAGLIKWIESLPEDASFTKTFKSEIVAGIKEYEKKNESEVTGWDFFDAEDADDIMELCGVKKRFKAKQLLRIIGAKKRADYDAQAGQFTLKIQAMRGKLYNIKHVSGSTKISTVKWRFMEELGDQAAADEYKGKLSKWNQNKCKIQLKTNGTNMSDKMTLGEYGIVNSIHMPLIALFRVRGGGFSVNIRGKQGIFITLRTLFTADSLVSEVAQAYKDEEKMVKHYKVEKILLQSRGYMLKHDKTLGDYNITNENNLITVLFKTAS